MSVVMRYLATVVLATLAVSCDQDMVSQTELSADSEQAVEVPAVEVQDARGLPGLIMERGDLLVPLPRLMPDGTLVKPQVYLACLIVTWKLAPEATENPP